MLQEQALELHNILDSDDKNARSIGANWFFKLAGVDWKVESERQAKEALYSVYSLLLDSGKYTEAALLLWGDKLFDPRPRSVQRIWNGLMNYSKILIPGGSAQGKSFTPAAWAVLWWTHDPAYTSIKVISVTASHASSNILATIKTFHERSIIPLPGKIMDRSIGLDNEDDKAQDKRASIEQVNLPTGSDIKARLRGFHPVPRPWHRIFGSKSRVGVLIDEGEDVEAGLWEGLENVLSTETEDGIHIKIASGTNPKKRESPFAQRCEPLGGWPKFDIDNDMEWDGPESLGKWHVIRLDPSISENVVEQKEVFPGMMTYQGYMNYLRKGRNDPAFFTFARGAWPESTAEFRITPPDFFNNSRGTLVFHSDVVPIASLDPAFAEGGDQAILTTGRYGTAIGFTSVDGEYEKWSNPHKALQIEQQFPVPKANTMVMAASVMQLLRHLKVRPEWFIMDRTGIGHGLCDALKQQYGDILGQSWSDGSTDRKILEEDSQIAEDIYNGVVTEMCFAFAQWLELGYVKFAPMLDLTKLMTQATNRKYYFSRGLMTAESKGDYKADTSSPSPDEYDSAIMTVHLVRLRESQKAQMVPNEQIRQDLRKVLEETTQYGVIDQLEFYSVT